jgi:DNA-binding Lrp family transcriptional regulator
VKLDEYDLKLINLLMENSRLSLSELSRLLSLSRQTVKARLERLEKEGIIEKYTVKVSPELEKVGETVIVILETDRPEKLEDSPEITEINKVTSRRYVVKAVVDRLSELSDILESPDFKVLEVMPVLKSKKREVVLKIKVPFKCDYCGKEIVDEPLIYKYRNRVYFFCCKVCLREFKSIEGS